jgi:hypothetical protein
MNFVVADAFRSDSSLAQTLESLRANTRWRWRERDSEFWDDYISAQSNLQPAMVRIFVEGYGYLLERKFQDDGLRESWAPAAVEIMDRLLPPHAATGVRKAESND